MKRIQINKNVAILKDTIIHININTSSMLKITDMEQISKPREFYKSLKEDVEDLASKRTTSKQKLDNFTSIKNIIDYSNSYSHITLHWYSSKNWKIYAGLKEDYIRYHTKYTEMMAVLCNYRDLLHELDSESGTTHNWFSPRTILKDYNIPFEEITKYYYVVQDKCGATYHSDLNFYSEEDLWLHLETHFNVEITNKDLSDKVYTLLYSKSGAASQAKSE
jgi:hypothetical protein